MATSDLADLEELRVNLEEYKEQLKEVEALLLDDPDNQEYQSIHQELSEAIALTESALADHAAQQPSSSAPSDAQPAATRKRRSRFEPLSAGVGGATPALPVDLVSQIAYAKARSALQGQGPAAWAVGADCVARYTDGRWQNAHIRELAPDGMFLVVFEGSQTVDAVSPMDCKPRDLANYKGVHGPVRKAVKEEALLTEEIPEWMKIKETDSEKVKEKKRRNLKAYKKKFKFQQMDLSTKQKADNWKNFLCGKSKHSGLASTKKKSMFAVPDNPKGRVGVIGSGKEMTNAPHKRTRLDF